MLDRIVRFWRWLARVAGRTAGLFTLSGQELTYERAARETRALRLMVTGAAVVASLGLLIFVSSWPVARARAARLLFERQELNARLSQACYAQATKQLRGYMTKVMVDPQMTMDEKDARLGDAAMIGLSFAGKRDACEISISRAKAAKDSIPHRLWDSSLVRDPVTGLLARVDETPEKVAARVMTKKMADGEVKNLGFLASHYGRKGAEPMPSRFEWSSVQPVVAPAAQAQPVKGGAHE